MPRFLLIASILPKEFEITDSRPKDISDEQLHTPIGFIDRRLAGRSVKAEKSRHSIEDRLKYYKPYPKQRDFRDADARSRERLLMADDQFRQDARWRLRGRHACHRALSGLVARACAPIDR
jgi:hypothetical protein